MNPYVKCHTFLTKRFENDIAQDSSMRHPLHNPVFLVQRHNRIRPNICILGLKTWGNTKLPTTRLYILLEQFIDDTVEFHKTCIFAQIVLRLNEERITNAVSASHSDFPWLLHRVHHLYLVIEGYNQQEQQ